MNKLFAVLKREYIQAVRKKMFIVMTFLLPLLMAAAMVLPTMLMAKGMSGKQVTVIDGTGKLRDTFGKPVTAKGRSTRSTPMRLDLQWIDATGKDPETVARPYLARVSQTAKEGRLDAVLILPPDTLVSEKAQAKYYTRTATDMITQERLSSMTNRAVQRLRLSDRGVSVAELDKVMSPVTLDGIQLTKSGGAKKSSGAANFLIGFVFTALLFIPSFIYGLEIMRGILQEKNDRVVEVLISSMTPSQLLVGKVTGVALVGLTQISAWILMGAAAGTFGAATMTMAGVDLTQLLRLSTVFYFAIFFLLAYMTFVCVYAIGGTVCNSEKEANQLIAPIVMVMMLPWFLLVAIITNPDSTLSVGLSLAPVFAPITMFVRTLVSEPPLWHVALSILVSIATIAVFFWATVKIFRIGILSYGKRPTIPELWRWMKVA